MDQMQRIDASDPDALNAATAALLAEEPAAAPTIDPQPSGFVRLAGGLVRGVDPSEVEYDAEVRELDGADEEYVDRVRQGDPTKVFDAIVERGTKSIGGQAVSKETIRQLLLGDAEMLYLKIAEATYGEGIEYYGWTCPGCQEMLDVTIEFDDIPIERLADTHARLFDVPLRKGRVASCRLPIVGDLAAVKAAETPAEEKTVLVAHCVLAIRDTDGSVTPVAGDLDIARSLGQVDRNRIVREIGNRRVGPNYNEVTFKHAACGEETPFPISAGDLFPGV